MVKIKSKNTLKLCLFLVFAISPFLTVTNLIGLETFLDSFDNPDFYLCVEDEDNYYKSNTNNNEYLIIQRTNHPNFKPSENDIIIYCDFDGEIKCNKIHHINSMMTENSYYALNENNKVSSKPIFESQIIGKIIKTVDNNIWNSLSIKVWETSIHNLNINALLTND